MGSCCEWQCLVKRGRRRQRRSEAGRRGNRGYAQGRHRHSLRAGSTQGRGRTQRQRLSLKELLRRRRLSLSGVARQGTL